MTDDEIRKAAEELVEAEIADEAALLEIENVPSGEARDLAERRKGRLVKKRDEALSRLASLLGKKWPPLVLLVMALL